MNRQNDKRVSPIQIAREAAGLTREGLADRTGLTLRTIERLESGEEHQPQRSTVRLIALVLGVDEETLRRFPLDEVAA